MPLSDEVREKLITAAFEVKKRSYSPYSKFPVGAALLAEDGTIITGCNVENASYGISVCAERSAICKAVSEGYRKFTAVAVTSDLDDFITPCGICRQCLLEFSMDMEVYQTKPDGSYSMQTIDKLLPGGFTPMQLMETQNKKQ